MNYCQRGYNEQEVILEPIPGDIDEQPESLLEQLQNSSEDEVSLLNPRQLFVDGPMSNKAHSIDFDKVINETF